MIVNISDDCVEAVLAALAEGANRNNRAAALRSTELGDDAPDSACRDVVRTLQDSGRLLLVAGEIRAAMRAVPAGETSEVESEAPEEGQTDQDAPPPKRPRKSRARKTQIFAPGALEEDPTVGVVNPNDTGDDGLGDE